MNPDLLKFLSDKALSLVLFAGAGLAYWLKLPSEYCVALSTAAGLTYQVSGHPSQGPADSQSQASPPSPQP